MWSSWEQATEPFKGLTNKAKSSTEAKGSCSSVIFIMSITYIAIGAVYLHDCPVQEMIPIYLIVAGILYIISSLLVCLPCTQNPVGRLQNCLNMFLKFLMSLVSIFIFCWFIAGNYWIYSVFKPSYNKNGTDVSRYCNKTLYRFSFWMTTLFYMVLGFLVVIGCCLFCLCCLRADNSNNAGDNPPRGSAQKDKESNSVV